MTSVTLDNINEQTPMGANLIGDGATFRVWGGAASEVHILGSFIGWKPSNKTRLIPTADGHWWGFVHGVKDRDHYKFWVVGEAGGGFKRDPFARELDWAKGECVVRKDDFPWHDTGYVTPAFENFVIYQLHVGTFYTPRWPDAAGTFLDVAEKLPYLADLGVTAIQLLPIQEFQTRFSLGYNGVDYFSPESDFSVSDADLPPYVDRLNSLLVERSLSAYDFEHLRGEMNQLKALVDLAHIHDIAVIFDVVYNHAGGDFGNESIYFFDRQHGQDESPPIFTNSLYFGDKEHAGGRVFDFSKPQVCAFLIDNARFFLNEYKIDGLRYDQTSVIDHDGAPHGWQFLQNLTSAVRATKPSALQKAEYWGVNPFVTTPSQYGGAGFDTTLADGLRIALRSAISAASVPGHHPVPMSQLAQSLWQPGFSEHWRFVQGPENHDLVLRDDGNSREPRIASLSDPSNPRSWYARSRSRVAMGICLTAPGIPMMFMGQEFLEDKQWSDNLEYRPELKIYWEGLEQPDPSMRDFLRFTRELLRLRWRQPALRGNGFRATYASDEDRILAFHRWVPGEGYDVVVVVSLNNSTLYHYQIGFPTGGTWFEVFNSDVYDNWVNPITAGNGGQVYVDGGPLHGFETSASIVVPANALLVFARA
jgi:1,4-alpha-glucan branching enzyme